VVSGKGWREGVVGAGFPHCVRRLGWGATDSAGGAAARPPCEKQKGISVCLWEGEEARASESGVRCTSRPRVCVRVV
jgi:hypothetical protein